MAIEKQVNIKVTETGLDEINQDLVSLDKNITKVDDSSKGASKGLKDVGENGGAIAVLDSLTGGLATRVRDAAEATKLFSFNLKGVRTALIATGIGAFVVALGVVVAYWDEIKIALSDTNFLLGRQIKQLENVSSQLESQLSIIDKRMELNRLEGKSNEELQKQKLAIIAQEQEINRTLIEKLEWQLENEKALSKELTLWEKIQVEALRLVDPAKAAALEAASQLENNERTFELQQKINDAKGKQVDLEIAIFKEQNPGVDPKERGKVKSVGTVLTAEERQAQLDAQSEFFKEQLGLKKYFTNELSNLELEGVENTVLANKKKEENVKKTNKNITESDRLTAEARKVSQIELLNATANILGSLSNLFEEGTKASKAAALAEIVIGTGIGFIQGLDIAQKGAKATGPAAPFAFPIFYATQVAAVLSAASKAKDILSKVPGGGASPNIGGAGGGGGVSAPSFNVVGTSGVNQLAETLQGQDEPIRAYVVGNDVTTQQAEDRNIITTATIG